ncbi:hypothetical protein Ancab_016429 [Ancistrocladus abbreviatus]
MFLWLKATLIAVSVAIFTALLILVIRRCLISKKLTPVTQATSATTTQAWVLQSAQAPNIEHHLGASIHRQADLGSRKKPNYHMFRRGLSTKPLFSWADHPALITDAVESGWSRFAFTNYMSSPSLRSSLLGLCAVGDQVRGSQMEIGWEVGEGSVDFMQRIRLNSGLKSNKMISSSSSINSGYACSVIRTALPLPGPPLGNSSSFPQEAYFEITVLSYVEGEGGGKIKGEGEKTKLIQGVGNLDSLVHVSSSNSYRRQGVEEEGQLGGGRGEAVRMSLGLTTGGSLPLRIPGSYPGSIGFNSNGSVYLDGIKLVFESEKQDWGQVEKVIGCGFDPRQKKVFFTIDSELVHVIYCKAEEFSTPLYPALAANIDITVLVNLGQSSFSYAPANVHRTPNPCFIGPLVNPPSASLGYEDSRELFSMGRIDSGWLQHCATKSSTTSIGFNSSKAADYEEESEADLFEIVLDVSASKPSLRTSV